MMGILDYTSRKAVFVDDLPVVRRRYLSRVRGLNKSPFRMSATVREMIARLFDCRPQLADCLQMKPITKRERRKLERTADATS